MKKFCTLLIILLLAQTGFSQSLPVSTMGQIYNFSVGDSFEYSFTYLSYNAPHCYGYSLLNITSAASVNDTLIYTYSNGAQFSSQSSPNCSAANHYLPFGYAYGFGYIGADTFKIFSPDSSIFLYDYKSLCPYSFYCSDSIFIDSTYNYHTQNMFSSTQFDGELNEIYGDSLGLVYGYQGTPNTNYASTIQLIWYHKANGEQWGHNVPIIISGIDYASGTSLTVKIFPNPSSGNISLQLAYLPNTDNYFELFDASGRKVYRQKITTTTTDINLKSFSSGLYLWQMQSGENTVDRGKLVLQ